MFDFLQDDNLLIVLLLHVSPDKKAMFYNWKIGAKKTSSQLASPIEKEHTVYLGQGCSIK